MLACIREQNTLLVSHASVSRRHRTVIISTTLRERLQSAFHEAAELTETRHCQALQLTLEHTAHCLLPSRFGNI